MGATIVINPFYRWDIAPIAMVICKVLEMRNPQVTTTKSWSDDLMIWVYLHFWMCQASRNPRFLLIVMSRFAWYLQYIHVFFPQFEAFTN